jgi:hypothetical protein
MTKITLSMPRTATGEARIRARGQDCDAIVGDCVRSGNQWRATLWSRVGQHTTGDNFIYRGSLKRLRIDLEEQIGREGPWWTQLPAADDASSGGNPGDPGLPDGGTGDYVVLIGFD